MASTVSQVHLNTNVLVAYTFRRISVPCCVERKFNILRKVHEVRHRLVKGKVLQICSGEGIVRSGVAPVSVYPRNVNCRTYQDNYDTHARSLLQPPRPP